MLSVADDSDLADERDAAGMTPICQTKSKDIQTAKTCAKGRYAMQVDCKLHADLLAMQVQAKCAIEK